MGRGIALRSSLALAPAARARLAARLSPVHGQHGTKGRLATCRRTWYCIPYRTVRTYVRTYRRGQVTITIFISEHSAATPGHELARPCWRLISNGGAAVALAPGSGADDTPGAGDGSQLLLISAIEMDAGALQAGALDVGALIADYAATVGADPTRDSDATNPAAPAAMLESASLVRSEVYLFEGRPADEAGERRWIRRSLQVLTCAYAEHVAVPCSQVEAEQLEESSGEDTGDFDFGLRFDVAFPIDTNTSATNATEVVSKESFAEAEAGVTVRADIGDASDVLYNLTHPATPRGRSARSHHPFRSSQRRASPWMRRTVVPSRRLWRRKRRFATSSRSQSEQKIGAEITVRSALRARRL